MSGSFSRAVLNAMWEHPSALLQRRLYKLTSAPEVRLLHYHRAPAAAADGHKDLKRKAPEPDDQEDEEEQQRLSPAGRAWRFVVRLFRPADPAATEQPDGEPGWVRCVTGLHAALFWHPAVPSTHSRPCKCPAVGLAGWQAVQSTLSPPPSLAQARRLGSSRRRRAGTRARRPAASFCFAQRRGHPAHLPNPALLHRPWPACNCCVLNDV